MQQQDTTSIRLTGAWERSGKFGTFSVGKVSLTELNEAISQLGNPERVEIVVAPVKEKQHQNSPDYNISLRIPMQTEGGTDTNGKGFIAATKNAGKSYAKRA